MELDCVDNSRTGEDSVEIPIMNRDLFHNAENIKQNKNLGKKHFCVFC